MRPASLFNIGCGAAGGLGAGTQVVWLNYPTANIVFNQDSQTFSYGFGTPELHNVAGNYDGGFGFQGQINNPIVTPWVVISSRGGVVGGSKGGTNFPQSIAGFTSKVQLRPGTWSLYLMPAYYNQMQTVIIPTYPNTGIQPAAIATDYVFPAVPRGYVAQNQYTIDFCTYYAALPDASLLTGAIDIIDGTGNLIQQPTFQGGDFDGNPAGRPNFTALPLPGTGPLYSEATYVPFSIEPYVFRLSDACGNPIPVPGLDSFEGINAIGTSFPGNQLSTNAVYLVSGAAYYVAPFVVPRTLNRFLRFNPSAVLKDYIAMAIFSECQPCCFMQPST